MKLPVVKIISGGQTGVDQAGLHAAERLGLSTGGHAPLGWRTLDGPAPWLGSKYGLIEAPVADYSWRTSKNVLEADATVRIARYLDSSGERCTLKAIKKHKKPSFDVEVHTDCPSLLIEPFRDFLVENGIYVLNVAGNSERTAPGIGEIAEEFLMKVLS